MVHDQQTGKYVPVITILMTHFNQYLYWEALTRVVVLSDWKLDVGSYTTDFERAVMNECAQHFPEGVHIGCFFHLKQAVRKHMLEKLKFNGDVITAFMETGAFDLLTILPHDEVESYGIDYLRSIFEPDDLSVEEKARWVEFWNYYGRQWSPILDSWNICDADGDVKAFVNRTNNALERYNRRFNDLFHKKPSLIEFVQILEEESRKQAAELEDIRKSRRVKPMYQERTIPAIPAAYVTFRDAKKAAEAAQN
jgi:hypothetical protein